MDANTVPELKSSAVGGREGRSEAEGGGDGRGRSEGEEMPFEDVSSSTLAKSLTSYTCMRSSVQKIL